MSNSLYKINHWQKLSMSLVPVMTHNISVMIVLLEELSRQLSYNQVLLWKIYGIFKNCRQANAWSALSKVFINRQGQKLGNIGNIGHFLWSFLISGFSILL